MDRAAGPRPGPQPRRAVRDIKFLIRDRKPNFTRAFDTVFPAAGTRIVRTAVQAPRMNVTCERLVGTLRREFLDRVLILGDRVLILGERHLRAVLTEYQVHYNTARPHQGIAQRVPDDEHVAQAGRRAHDSPATAPARPPAEASSHRRLGGAGTGSSCGGRLPSIRGRAAHCRPARERLPTASLRKTPAVT